MTTLQSTVIRGGAPAMARATSLNALVAAISGIGSQLAVLAVTPFLIWRIGLDGYGLWALCSSLSRYGLLTDVLFAPIVAYVSQYAAHGDLARVRIVATASTLFYCALFLTVVPLTALVAPFALHSFHLAPAIAPQAPTFLTGYVAFFFGTVAATGLGSVLNGLGLLRRSAQVTSFGNVLFALVAAACAGAGLGMWALLIGVYVQLAWTAIALYVLCRHKLGHVFVAPWRLERGVVGKLFSVGGWLQFSTLATLLGAETSQVLIGIFIGLPAVALYEVGNKLARALRTIAFYPNSAILPTLSTLAAHGEPERLGHAVTRAGRYLAVPTFAAAGFLVAAQPQLSRIWLGNISGLSLTVTVVIVLSVTYLIETVTSVPMTTLRALGRPRLEASASAVGVVVNLALTFALIQHFGVVGVLAGTLGGCAASSAVFMTRFYSALDLDPRRALFPWLASISLVTASAGVAVHFAIRLLPHALFGSRVGGGLTLAVVGIAYGILFLAGLGAVRYIAGTDITAVRTRLTRSAA